MLEIERLFDKSRGIQGNHTHYFREIVVFSTNLIHVFMRSRKNPDHAIVFVTRVSANVGMVLVRSRAAALQCEAAL